MLQSLQNTVRETISTQSAIQQALRSPSGLRVVWVIVEAEEDEAVYKKFLHPSSTVVQTSKDETGRKGYSNLEDIVLNIKGEEPRAHIMGIRDTDYTRYEDGYETPDNIFLTDRRDLEMMMLDAESVKQMLHTWAPAFDAAFAKCVPICRHFGYLRIYNSLNRLFVTFHISCVFPKPSIFYLLESSIFPLNLSPFFLGIDAFWRSVPPQQGYLNPLLPGYLRGRFGRIQSSRQLYFIVLIEHCLNLYAYLLAHLFSPICFPVIFSHNTRPIPLMPNSCTTHRAVFIFLPREDFSGKVTTVSSWGKSG